MRNGGPKVALTGGIGSGKSFVAKRLLAHGVSVYDCDSAAKRLMNSSPLIRERLTALVGPDTYVDGRLNKAAVARFLMLSEENTQRVNGVVHPAVAEDFYASGLDWLESAILFESGFVRYVDVAVCVTAPLETRIGRVMRRDGISREQTLGWMARQWPQEEVARRSDFEIVNDGVLDIDEQIARVLTALSHWGKENRTRV